MDSNQESFLTEDFFKHNFKLKSFCFVYQITNRDYIIKTVLHVDELLQYSSYVASCFVFTDSLKTLTDPNIVYKQLQLHIKVNAL